MRKFVIVPTLLFAACAIFNVKLSVAGDRDVVEREQQKSRIAIVDLKKIVADSPRVAAMRTKLKNQFDPESKRIATLQKELQDLVDKYNKNNAIMKEQEKKDLQDDIVNKQTKFRDAQSNFQKDVFSAEEQSMQTIYKQVQNAAEKIAKKHSYDIVINKAAVFFSRDEDDITSAILDDMK